jgi:hypothetical protein
VEWALTALTSFSLEFGAPISSALKSQTAAGAVNEELVFIEYMKLGTPPKL